MASENFETFMRIFFGDPFEAAHDGIDPKILLSLKGDEKEQAQKLLLDAIENSEDNRPFVGVGHLELKSASEIIKRRLSKDFRWAYTKVEAAWALWKIEKDPEAITIILSVLKDKNQGEFTRIVAVGALRDFGKRKDVVSALVDAFSNEKDNSLVGSVAFETVGYLFSSDARIRDLVNLILDTKREERFKFRRVEIKELKDLIRRQMKH